MRNTEGRSGQLESGGSLILFTKHNEVRPLADMGNERRELYIYFFLLVCFTSYFVFSIAVLPHSPGVVYYHLLLRRETRIPGAAPFSLQIGIWDIFVHRGQKSYTPTAFRNCGPLQE